MTYAAQETSAADGQPIELFDFRLGTTAYTWTTNPDAVTYNDIVYQPLSISRTSLQLDPEKRAEALTIRLPATSLLVQRYINNIPRQKATLTIRRVHRNDTADQVVQLFKGVARTVGFSNSGQDAEIAVVPLTAELLDSIPRFMFSSVCNHVLFDQACGVNQSSFRHLGDVLSFSNNTLEVSGLDARGDGWADGGFVQTTSGDFRLVVEQLGDNARLLYPFTEDLVGQEVQVFAGCDHSPETCATKFTNLTNNGGFPFVPTKNIFATGVR